MKIIKTLTLHNARALLDCRRREHGPPVKNYGIPFAVHVHAIANGGFTEATVPPHDPTVNSPAPCGGAVLPCRGR